MTTSQPTEFPPPPVYQVQQQSQQRIRFNAQQQLPGRPGAPQYTVASGSLTQVCFILKAIFYDIVTRKKKY